MNNPITLELEPFTVLSQVSTYNVLLEAGKRLRRMRDVDLTIVDLLNDILTGIEIDSHD